MSEVDGEIEAILEKLRAVSPAERGPQCPPDEEWLRVAAGQVEASRAEVLIGHAAACDHCGPLLRAAFAYFSDDVTPDEDAELVKLNSSREDWQRRLALQISGDEPRTTLRAWIWPPARIPVWGYATAIAVLALVTTIGIRLLRNAPVETLLAEAYTEQRTMELRIPMAAHAPVRLTRGSNRSRLDRPAALLEAEARIAGELRREPRNPAVLEARGRADLLDRNYQDAIESFKQALKLAPEGPGLLTGLASAYFESGEANQRRASDYAAAVELLDRALKADPEDRVALFNRAIVYERMGEPGRAIEDWRHYLHIDPASDWTPEAKQRLSELLGRSRP